MTLLFLRQRLAQAHPLYAFRHSDSTRYAFEPLKCLLLNKVIRRQSVDPGEYINPDCKDADPVSVEEAPGHFVLYCGICYQDKKCAWYPRGI